MKRKILLSFFTVALLGIGLLHAQTYVNFTVNQAAPLQGDAGLDDVLCEGDTIQLGGSPAASGGTAAYTYAWTGSNLISTNVGNPMAVPMLSASYVLTITDANNCTAIDTVVITVDTCVGISDPQLPIDLAVYPNPNEGQFRVVINGNSNGETMNLQLIDMLGRVIEEASVGELNGQLQQDFDLPMVSKGTYFLKLQVAGQIFQRQIVIQ